MACSCIGCAQLAWCFDLVMRSLLKFPGEGSHDFGWSAYLCRLYGRYILCPQPGKGKPPVMFHTTMIAYSQIALLDPFWQDHHHLHYLDESKCLPGRNNIVDIFSIIDRWCYYIQEQTFMRQLIHNYGNLFKRKVAPNNKTLVGVDHASEDRQLFSSCGTTYILIDFHCCPDA